MELSVNLSVDQPRAAVRITPGCYLNVSLWIDTHGVPVNLIKATLKSNEVFAESWSEEFPYGHMSTDYRGLSRYLLWQRKEPIPILNCPIYRVFLRPDFMKRKPRRLVIGVRELWIGSEVFSETWKV